MTFFVLVASRPIVAMFTLETRKGDSVEWWSTVVLPYSAYHEITERLARGRFKIKRRNEAAAAAMADE